MRRSRRIKVFIQTRSIIWVGSSNPDFISILFKCQTPLEIEQILSTEKKNILLYINNYHYTGCRGKLYTTTKQMLSESVKFFSTHPVNGCRNETVHFILYVGKAKRCFGGGRFFFCFLKDCS